jgi:hypothetical protein
MKRCMVSFYTGNFVLGIPKLLNSLYNINNFEGDSIIFSPDATPQIMKTVLGNSIYFKQGYPYNEKMGICPTHEQAKFRFKSMLLQHVRELGYDQAMWLDSAIRVHKNPEKYFNLLDDYGAIAFDSDLRYPNSEWTTDKCLEVLGCSLEEAKTMNQCYGGIQLWDFNHYRGSNIFEDFLYYCSIPEAINDSPTNRPDFKAHRHDQSILTYLLKKHHSSNMPYGGTVWALSEDIETFSPTFVLGDIPV